MNDRHRAVKLFYSRHPEEKAMDLRMKLERWTGEVVHDYLEKAAVVMELVKVKGIHGSMGRWEL